MDKEQELLDQLKIIQGQKKRDEAEAKEMELQGEYDRCKDAPYVMRRNDNDNWVTVMHISDVRRSTGLGGCVKCRKHEEATIYIRHHDEKDKYRDIKDGHSGVYYKLIGDGHKTSEKDGFTQHCYPIDKGLYDLIINIAKRHMKAMEDTFSDINPLILKIPGR